MSVIDDLTYSDVSLNDEAYNLGMDFYLSGRGVEANPFLDITEQWLYFRLGWFDARSQFRSYSRVKKKEINANQSFIV